MIVKLLTEHHLEFLKKAAQAHLSLHLSKYHIVGNHMTRLNYSHTVWVDKSGGVASEMSVVIFYLLPMKMMLICFRQLSSLFSILIGEVVLVC